MKPSMLFALQPFALVLNCLPSGRYNNSVPKENALLLTTNHQKFHRAAAVG